MSDYSQGKRCACGKVICNAAKTGVCRACYYAGRKQAPPRPATCHPERKHHSKGLCAQCANAARLRRWRQENREHVRAQTRAWQRRFRKSENYKRWYAANKARIAARQKKTYDARSQDEKRLHIVRRYGLSVGEYNAMLLRQGGKCAVCGGADKLRALAVDHCHETGVVRGLLCAPCNMVVGVLEGRGGKTVLAAVAAYLERATEIRRNG